MKFYLMTLMATFDIADFNNGIGVLLFILSTFLMVLVSLNLLIAIMSDSVDRVQEQGIVSKYREKASLLRTIEEHLGSTDLLREAWFPKYLLVTVPESTNPIENAADPRAWKGRLAQAKADLQTALPAEGEVTKLGVQQRQLSEAQERMQLDLDKIHAAQTRLHEGQEQLAELLSSLLRSRPMFASQDSAMDWPGDPSSPLDRNLEVPAIVGMPQRSVTPENLGFVPPAYPDT